MRRTPLVRRTPLRATSSLRRSPPKPRRRVNFPSTSERDFVLSRDRQCMAAILFAERAVPDPGACQGRLVYGHARTAPGGLRPPSGDGIGRMFAVAECDWHNYQHWEARSDARAAINERLDRLYPGRREMQ